VKTQSETIQDALDSIEQLNDRQDTTQEMLSDLSEQIGRLHEAVTGVEGGSGGTFAPHSLEDIGKMLRGLQLISEPQLRAKAFQLFDLEATHIRKIERFEKQDETLFAAALKIAVDAKLGLSAEMLDRFYREWKTQRSQ
jgi:hypothetical protein